MSPSPFPLRHLPRQHWAPMSDAEWAALAPLLHRGPHLGSPARGRPPADLRRCWDAIFWVACSRGPWRALPPSLGPADSAHRALRRALAAGLLPRLLFAASPAGRGFLPASLAWRIARAWRRMTRLLTLGQLLLAKRLGMADALPCHPADLPRPHLSENIRAWMPLLPRLDLAPIVIPALLRLHHLMEGNRKAWRLTA